MSFFAWLEAFFSFCCGIFSCFVFFHAFLFCWMFRLNCCRQISFFPTLCWCFFETSTKESNQIFNSHDTATESAQKLYQTKVLQLQIRATINSCTLVLSFTVLNLSSVEVALVIAPFSFNKYSAQLKIADIVVLGTLLISWSDGIKGTFFHSGRFLSLFNKDSVVCCYLCNIGFNSCCTTLASILKSTLAWFSSKSLILQMLKSASEGIKLKKCFK